MAWRHNGRSVPNKGARKTNRHEQYTKKIKITKKSNSHKIKVRVHKSRKKPDTNNNK